MAKSDKTYIVIGATGHGDSINRHEEDFYATPPKAGELLLEIEPQLNNIWECACGAGHLAKVFDQAGKLARATDLYDRGYGETGVDFLLFPKQWDGDIVTNPPFKASMDFILTALSIIPEGRYVGMFLPTRYLEGIERRDRIFDPHPPIRVWISSKRIGCARNADFGSHSDAAISFAWYVWQKGYRGDTVLKWFN